MYGFSLEPTVFANASHLHRSGGVVPFIELSKDADGGTQLLFEKKIISAGENGKFKSPLKCEDISSLSHNKAFSHE